MNDELNNNLKDAAKEIAKKKLMQKVLISFAGSLPFFLGIFTVFIAVFLVLGLFSFEASANDGSSSGSYTYYIDDKVVSNLKVRLLDCAGYDPVEGETLIDFETYILGVVYQENGDGPHEALKAQAVAARSYILNRPKVMGGAYGLSLEEENGQWIITVRSCTNDQVFCHPDKGCWSNVLGGQTRNNMTSEEWSNCTVHSGYDSTKNWTRKALAEDSDIRKAVEETKGQVLVDDNDNIIYTPYVNDTQQSWNQLAREGKDYFEILMDTYGDKGAAKISTQILEDNFDSSNLNTNIGDLINMSQEDIWLQLIGKSSSDNRPYITESAISNRMETITVPYRTWNSNSTGSNPKTDTIKKEKNITVNAALADLWLAFFTDVYNEAPNFVIATFDGCYNYRNVTNGNTLSAHAYGVACDINASTTKNGYNETSISEQEWSRLPETRSKYQIIYKGSKVVEIAHRYTLINGSDWTTPNDSMHFSFIGDWSRSRAQECQGKKIC